MEEALTTAAASLAAATEKLIWMTLVFGALALAVKGRAALDAARRSASESRVNLVYYLTDAALLVPATMVGIAAWNAIADAAGLALVPSSFWTDTPRLVTLLACVAVSDFAGYWRHRLMHVAALWPAHAIHHSDREMTWLALARFHPVNRAITVTVNIVVLSLCGFPAWAIVLNALIRNWYGHYLHADLPWTYGRIFGRVLVSPVLHRWHHTRDEAQSGRNFSTVFAVWDVLFGTWHCPHRNVGALGIDEPGFPDNWLGQIAWPFRVWARALRPAPALGTVRARAR